MISAIPDSGSAVLRATHILLLRIQAARAEEWSSPPTGWLQRAADLVLILDEILKGVTNERPGTQVRVRVTQYSLGPLHTDPAPGVWSNQSLDPGTEFLAFCHSASTEAGRLLEEGSCDQLMPVAVLPDVRLALRAETATASAADLLTLARPAAASLGYVFAEYVWAKLGPFAMADAKIFDLLLQFLEMPELSLIARWTLLKSVYAAVAHSQTISAWHVHRLAVSMFRLIGATEDASMVDNIIQVFLPNLLGEQGGLADRSADDVFRDFPDERPRVEQLLRNSRGNASTADLLRWLHRGGS